MLEIGIRADARLVDWATSTGAKGRQETSLLLRSASDDEGSDEMVLTAQAGSFASFSAGDSCAATAQTRTIDQSRSKERKGNSILDDQVRARRS